MKKRKIFAFKSFHKKDLSRKSNPTDLVTIKQGHHFMERPSMYFEILFRNVEVALK